MNLLGRTLIAESQDAGAAVARKYHYRLRIVCLDGTQFNSGGSLTGGSQKSREGSLISRKALLEELRQSQAENDERLTGLERQRAALEKSAQSLSEEARALDDTRQQAQLDLQKASWQAESAEHEAAQLQSSSAKMKEQMAGLDQAQQSLTEQLSQKVTLKDSWQTQPETDTRELETARKKALDELEQCRQAVTEQKITVATLQEQLSHLAEQLQQNEALKEQADADGQRLAQRRAATLQRQQEAQELVETLGANITTKSQEAAEKDKAKDDFYQQRTDNFQQSQRMDEALKELRERLDDWNRRINASDIQLEKYRGEIQRSEERLALQGLTRQEAMERRREGTLKELTEKVGELRQRISELGQINPNADEEYRAAVEKQAFFTKQCDDLLEARTKLEAVVAEIDTAMASQFDAAFKEISVHFQQIFSRLFGGGSAQIILTNKQDILGSGVEFYIQPPGKKQQQLNLLSGGERALTVIALLFSFLAYHPAPFCLVDEVDAALDEANVERFGRYLKNYSGNTQFIVITHRRKTMEAASTLQGVTMEEKGVSRLLTVKVDELLKEGT
jgi:chromosome segregation protein